MPGPPEPHKPTTDPELLPHRALNPMRARSSAPWGRGNFLTLGVLVATFTLLVPSNSFSNNTLVTFEHHLVSSHPPARRTKFLNRAMMEMCSQN
jgi:hypothetical protein